MLTKNDISAIRNANDICVHLNARHPNGLVRLIKRKPYDPKPFETDQEHVLEGVKVQVETGLAQTALENGVGEFFAMAGIYHDQATPVSSILKSLRVGDELTFSFYPDGQTNAYVAEAGLHADLLYLYVYREGKRRITWELAHSICPNNSARMCKGVPNSESYDRDAKRLENRRLA